MKHSKSVSLALVAALLLCLFAGCGQAKTVETVPESGSSLTATDSDPAGIAIQDMMGRSVVLDAPAERIVAITAADCEILYALGCGDKLVGRGAYCDWPAEVLDVPAVESGSLTNIEQIIALDPDVILMGDMEQTEDQVNKLESAGIRVFVSNSETIEGTYDAIRMIGAIMGKDDEAIELMNGMEATFADLAAKAEGRGGKTVYFEVSPLEWGLWAAGKGSFMDEAAQMLGLKNIFDDVEGWGAVSEEQVLARNPDYIVTVSMYYGEGPTPEEEIASRAGWEDLTAVKNNAILNISNNELTRPGPRLADGAKQLFDFVYGE